VDTRLSSLISTNDANASNYVRVASNVIALDYKRLDGNVSNYVGAVDTRLSSLISTNDTSASNYVRVASNVIALDYKRLDGNVSNYVRVASNVLASSISYLYENSYNDQKTLNVINNSSYLITSNKLQLPIATTSVLGGVKVDGSTITINPSTGVISGANTYVLPTATTSVLGGVKVDGSTITINPSTGVISGANTYVLPIATTSVLGGVKQGNNTSINASGIISVDLSSYNGNAIINGNLTASNLTVLGSSTTLDTNVYITERLEIFNDSLNNAVIIKQKANGYNIMNVSNLTNEVFSIGYNGNITFKESINNITATQFNQIANIATNDANVSNYVRVTSNALVLDYKRLDGNVSNYVGVSSNALVLDYKRLDANVSNYVRATSNFLYNNYSNLVANVAVSGGGLTYWKNITNTNKNSIYYGAPVKIGGDKTIDVANNYIMDIVGNIRVSGTITTGWSGDGGGSSDGGSSGTSGGGSGGSGDSYWNAINLTRHIYYTSNVKIGGTSNVAPTNKLEVDGNISATGQIISGFSDNRLKTITSNINNPMDIISNLNGFYYIPNDIAISNCSAKNKEDIGLSAQDVNKILPHIVNLAPFDSFVDNSNNLISKSGCNYLTVNYEKLAPVFIEAIKTLNEKIIYLTNEIEKLKAKG
jgi:hypothetical protein